MTAPNFRSSFTKIFFFRLRMNIVNKVIETISEDRNKRVRRHNHHKCTEEYDKLEELVKAYDWTIFNHKQSRYRRNSISAKNKMRDILDSFKQARNDLQKKYEWKYYNVSELWNNESYTAPSFNDNLIPSYTMNSTFQTGENQHNCTKEITIISSVFGASILFIVCAIKIYFHCKGKNLKNSEKK